MLKLFILCWHGFRVVVCCSFKTAVLCRSPGIGFEKVVAITQFVFEQAVSSYISLVVCLELSSCYLLESCKAFMQFFSIHLEMHHTQQSSAPAKVQCRTVGALNSIINQSTLLP